MWRRVVLIVLFILALVGPSSTSRCRDVTEDTSLVATARPHRDDTHADVLLTFGPRQDKEENVTVTINGLTVLETTQQQVPKNEACMLLVSLGWVGDWLRVAPLLTGPEFFISLIVGEETHEHHFVDGKLFLNCVLHDEELNAIVWGETFDSEAILHLDWEGSETVKGVWWALNDEASPEFVSSPGSFLSEATAQNMFKLQGRLTLLLVGAGGVPLEACDCTSSPDPVHLLGRSPKTCPDPTAGFHGKEEGSQNLTNVVIDVAPCNASVSVSVTLPAHMVLPGSQLRLICGGPGQTAHTPGRLIRSRHDQTGGLMLEASIQCLPWAPEGIRVEVLSHECQLVAFGWAPLSDGMRRDNSHCRATYPQGGDYPGGVLRRSDWVAWLSGYVGWRRQERLPGVIREIFRHVGTGNTPPFFVEFGHSVNVVTRESGANVAHLVARGWKGVLMDGDRFNSQINMHARYITSANIVKTLQELHVPKEPDFVSIDVDSADLWIMQQMLGTIRPRVLEIEYNAGFASNSSATFPDNPNIRSRGRCFGASLRALYQVGREAGYTLVYAEYDAVFVRADLMGSGLAPPWDSFDSFCGLRLPHPRCFEADLVLFLDYEVWRATGSMAAAHEAALPAVRAMNAR